MPENSPTRRRWFRFSLRTLFVFVTLLCLGLSYPIYWIRQRHQFLAQEFVFVDYYADGLIDIDELLKKPPPQPIDLEVEPPRMLKLFGERGVYTITLNKKIAQLPQDEIEARRLFPEAEIDVDSWTREGNFEP